MMTVGIDMIPSCIGTAGFSSMSIFMTLILSPSSPWICSTIGAIMRQGPHQVAQKSTSTGLSAFRTAVLKTLSVNSLMFGTWTPSYSIYCFLLLDSYFYFRLGSDFVSGLFVLVLQAVA